MASDRPLHEVVLEAAPEVEHRTANWARERGEKWQGRNIGPELAAVLKAADALAAAVVRKNMALRVMVEEARSYSEFSKFAPLECEMNAALAECAVMEERAAYDAACADLRRVLEGK